MKKQLISLSVLLGLLFIAGGFTAVFQGLDIIWQTICAFFPIFKPMFVQAFKDYFQSAQFIVAIVVLVLSSLGIYVTARFKKTLLFWVSIALDVISLLSIISNLAMCR